MNRKAAFYFLVCLILIATVLTGIQIRVPNGGRSGTLDFSSQSAAKRRAVEVYGKLPLRFEADSAPSGDMQADSSSAVKFVSRGNGYTLWLKANEAVLGMRLPQSANRTARSGESADFARNAPVSLLHVKLDGSNPSPRVAGIDELPGKSNYFIGNDPKRWRIGVTSYAKVKYQDVYPGVDLVYYGNQQQLEYDLVVAPGADPKAIHLDIEGAANLTVDAAGDLWIGDGPQVARFQRPVVYQQTNGERKEIRGRYTLEAGNRIGFELGKYDLTKPVVIDPVLVYNVTFGGTQSDAANGIAVDQSGNAYIAGSTLSTDFPTTSQAVQGTNRGRTDAFIVKLDSKGSLLYSTYLGGGSDDTGNAIAVDSAGNIYVTGATSSFDFPVFNAFQTTLRGTTNIFVAKLTPPGNSLIYSTYMGGSGQDIPHALALDSFNAAFIVGETTSVDFPRALNALITTYKGATDAFIIRIDPAGASLTYQLYLGGSNADVANAVFVDLYGFAYITGYTRSADFPTAGPPFQSFQAVANQQDAFVTKIDPAASAILYSTFLGGRTADIGTGIAADLAGNMYIAGTTSSTDFPNKFPVQGLPGGNIDNFVVKLNPTGKTLLFSTYLGGTSDEGPVSLVLDQNGNLDLAGTTLSNNFPLANPFQAALQGVPGSVSPAIGDVYAAQISSDGSTLNFSSYLGFAGHAGGALAVDSVGNLYVAGSSGAANNDTFVTKISLLGISLPALTSLSPSSVAAGSPDLNITISGTNFISTSVAQWNGSARPTVFVDVLHLIVTIPASDLTAGGTAQITVSTPGRGISNALTFTIATTAVPTLTSVQPSSIASGSSGFQLTVNGSGFIPGSVVRWNGSAHQTVFVTSSVLQATIPASDIASAGTAAITVFSAPPGGGASSSLPFTITGNPVVNQSGLVNGASFGSLPPAPASIASLFGSGLAASSTAATSLPLPTTLAGVTVRINGAAVPLFSVSPQQINFQLPWELQGQTQAAITVTSGSTTSAPVAISLASYGPGIFATNQQGSGQGAILVAQTGELAAPTGSVSGSAARPVNRGEFISIYATGLGPVINQSVTGAPGGVGATTTTPPTVTIGGVPATVTFAGLAPNFVGLYQINVQVPQAAPTGSAVPVTLTVGGVTSNTVTIAVQ